MKGKAKTTPLVRMACSPNTIVVLHPQNGDIVTLDLCLRKANEPSGLLTKSMAREEKEKAVKTIERIRLLGANLVGTMSRKTSREEILERCPAVTVWGLPPEGSGASSLVELDTSLPNSEFWKHARLVRIGDEELEVKYNVPTITAIVPPSTPFVGLPLVCSCITTLFTTSEEISYEWRLCHSDDTTDEVGTAALLSTSSVFVPTADLLNKKLVLRVTLDKETNLWSQVELAPVKMPPPPVDRWKETATPAPFPAFRMVTYNILYDDFCTSKFSKQKIYPFATNEVLDIERRQVRLLQELLAYHPDLVCLQECGQKVFERFLLPAMEACGYGGHYANKSGSVREGCGFLYRRERFALMGTTTINLNWETLERQHPKLAAEVAMHVELKEALSNITAIGATLLLREVNTNKELVLANTHLFYHANACHIRILQTYILLHHLKECAQRRCFSKEARDGEDNDETLLCGDTTRPIILGGDCNFTHTTGAYRLVTTGQVEEDHHSWAKGRLFWWGCDRQLGYSEEEFAEHTSSPSSSASPTVKKDTPESERPPLETYLAKNLHAGIALVDAYDRTDPSLPWTNYTMTFREVIDYIFFSEDSIDVLRTIPIPPESELSENYALPNAKYPSDHVALLADLMFKR